MNFIRRVPRRVPTPLFQRNCSSNAKQIFNKSCYSKVNYLINQNDNVQKAVVRFAANKIGCLAVVDNNNCLVGVFSERDCIKHIASSEKESAAIQIKEVCKYTPDIFVANPDDCVEDCMIKMYVNDIRHLVLVDETNQKLEGLISIKDIFREMIVQNKVLSFIMFSSKKNLSKK